MKTKNIIYAVLAVALTTLPLSSCEDYLDTMPDNRTTLDNDKKVANLLVSAYPQVGYLLINELMSDNSDAYNPKLFHGNRFSDHVYAWEDVTENDNEAPLNLWKEYYAAIANANQALESIKELGGAKSASLQTSKAEALLCRAYAHFLLVNEFCMAYNSKTSNNDLGIYYSKKVELFSDKHERGTVAQVYKDIDADIQKALPIVTDNYKVEKFHFNKKAAYAFATRFYLYYEKWDLALKYANLCLGENPKSNLTDWKAMNNVPNKGFARAQYYYNAKHPSNLLVSTYYSEAGIYFGPFPYYKRYAQGGYLSNNETLTASNVWGQGGFYLRPFIASGNGFDMSFLQKIPYEFEVEDPVTQIGKAHALNVLFTMDEVLLNRAEALVMLKQYDKAAADLDMWMHNMVKSDVTLTPKRIQEFYNATQYAYSDKSKMQSTVKKHLHPAFDIDKERSLQETMLQCVLGFKRIETLHQGLRWFDIKRYGIEIPRRYMGPDGKPEKLTDVLKVNDPRRAVQIPLDIQNAGVQPNPRNKAK